MKKTLAWIVLLGLALLQMAGDLMGLPALKGIGAAIGMSPAPKVFSAVKGFETYSAQFFLEWGDETGAQHSVKITPSLYARLRGPYNRRNVYGAALAYGPILAADEKTRRMFFESARFALCGKAPLLSELAIDASKRTTPLSIRFVPRAAGRKANGPHRLEVPCS